CRYWPGPLITDPSFTSGKAVWQNNAGDSANKMQSIRNMAAPKPKRSVAGYPSTRAKAVGYWILFHKFRRRLLCGPIRRILSDLEMWVMRSGTRALAGVVVVVWLSTGLFAQNQKQGAPSSAGQFDSLLHQAFDLHQKQDYAHSLPLLRRARKLQPQNYFVNLLLGIDLLRTGNPSGAIPYLRIAARLRLGEACTQLGRYAEAVDAYQRAVELAPSSAQVAVAFVDFSVARFSKLSGGLRA